MMACGFAPVLAQVEQCLRFATGESRFRDNTKFQNSRQVHGRRPSPRLSCQSMDTGRRLSPRMVCRCGNAARCVHVIVESDEHNGWAASLNGARWSNCVDQRSCGDGLSEFKDTMYGWILLSRLFVVRKAMRIPFSLGVKIAVVTLFLCCGRAHQICCFWGQHFLDHVPTDATRPG